MFFPRNREKGVGLVVVSWICLAVLCAASSAPCDKTRRVFTDPSGVITDGPTDSNYTQDSHCEWLIKAANKNQFITLSFLRMGTECSYDYVFVYDGDSFDAPLLGSFSGKTEPQNVTASSGYMLILLYSDTNYVLDGFRATYAIHDCPNNCTGHGLCVQHKCFCFGTRGGQDCSLQLCPNQCSNNGQCKGDRCLCKKGFSGESCSLKKNDKVGNSWHWLSRSESGMTRRAAHSAVYVNHTDSLYVFGGYDLNKVLGLLEVYKFSTSQWYDENEKVLRRYPTNEEIDQSFLTLFTKGNTDGSWQIGNRSSLFNLLLSSVSHHDKTTLPLMYSHSPTPYSESYLHFTDKPDFSNAIMKSNDTKPEPRYGHSACAFETGFVLYGGKLSDGSLSSELWLHDAETNRWTLRAVNSSLVPPGLTRHTLTAVKDELYVFGGSTVDGEFSSNMYKIKLSEPSMESWEKVQVRGGKELDVRVVAHSSVYHLYSNSILVYGGVVASVARFSKLSDRMFAFDIDNRHWSEIHYPRAHLRDTYVPRERAFHTSTIIGNYLVVFGGYSHRHNREEICYDGQMYLYHLGCHSWIPLEVLGPRELYPKRQGVFAHAAALKPPSTLLIAGGYHGNVNGDLLAYVVPSWQAGISNNDPESACPRHQTQPECLADPECGWCSADDTCYGRTIGSNCTTNLQSIRCGGICPALGECHSCLIHGPASGRAGARAPLPSVSAKLGLHQCSWCVQNARCHHKDDNYGVCGEDTPSQNPGWWGTTGTEVTTPEECKDLDKRPGLTFLRYQQPADWNHPDGVSVVNATTVDWSTGGGSNHIFTGASEARLRGWLRIPQYWNGTGETLHVCAGHSNISLALGSSTESIANLTAHPSACSPVDWPALFPGRLAVDMHANDTLHTGLYPSHHHAKMELLHNKTTESAKVFTFEFLEPYSDGQCHNYDNCLLCLADAACGWCELTNKCESRAADERAACGAEAGAWRYLTLQPAACPNCSNYISCERCVAGAYCEWWADEARCARRGRAGGAVVEARECPAPCRTRLDCEHCLDERGRCVWCEATRQCFSFSVYTSEYQFGLCREWLDRASSAPAADETTRKAGQCKSCQAHTQCSTCLRSMGCGWCHSHENPITGACTEGDFTRARADCASLLNVSAADAGWAYAQCPDVDECGLKLHDCHEHAVCNNTHGSYTCKCKQGYSGDGRKSCMQTCYNNCIHGYCLGAPHYKCHCDLGWTGADCSINCGCHNHSTCRTGVGRCDECQDWTEGKFCESCKPGSHGNATTGQGCRRCDCNDHGDETRGFCDVAVGECICKDNTEGQNCERCKPKFYGDPRHGGKCYYQCEPRGMLNASQTEGIGSYKSDPDIKIIGPSKECLWIISAGDIKDAIIQFTINSSTLNVPCDENAVYVYDGLGGVPDMSNNQQSQLLGVFCNGASSGIVEARSGNLTVHYKQGQVEQGFEGVYKSLACGLYCPWPRVCTKGHCVCREGFGGPDCEVDICRNNCSMTNNAGTCDTSYGRCLCNEGFGGDDCSIKLDKTQLVFTELFNSEYLSDGLDHLRKTLPRFGHSLVADRRGLWMFGGYSLSHGPLNDIRFFDTKNNTWMQVTVEATPDAKMPEGRYFHASEIYHSKQNIYIYGGLSLQEKNGQNKTLGDFWQFSLKDQRWNIINNKEKQPPPLAGHTLTLQKYQDYESLVLIGGFSLEEGMMADMWEFDLDNDKWIKLNCGGSKPAGIIGHSTVYHAPSQSLYVYGGILYSYNGTSLSNKLFAFHYPSKKWSELPNFPRRNHQHDLPQPAYLHSAVTTNDYMVVFGGRSDPDRRSDSLIAYIYGCNQWVRLVKGISIVGHPPPPTIAHAMAIDMESENDGYIYIIGGWTGSAHCQVTRISLPEDLCSLWSSSKLECRSQMGCSFCSAGNYTKCFLVHKPGCESSDRVSTNSGEACDMELVSRRACENFTTCASCLAAWPLYPEEKPACRWCESCAAAVGECVPTDESCTSIKCNAGTTYISDVGQCPEHRCVASDCDKCVNNQCTWTRVASREGQMTRISEEPLELFNWTCALIEEQGRASIRPRTREECPSRCHTYTDCQSCLSSDGAEGGFAECHWATYLGKCISPAYQPVYCAGGVCGLVLTKADKNKCPAPCDTFEQCTECLHHSHCGWCAIEGANGEGVCTEGSIDSPLEYSTRTSCAAVYTSAHQLNGTEDAFSWHYTRCPPENECENNHHQCKADSEVCRDLPAGYVCECGAGHRRGPDGCAAVCAQGCVRGACVQPDVCRCDFGYVGANCTIQCQCNGHAHCEGPDKLDKCIECHNNTMGNQCEKCKPNFVGDPTDNGQCIPCSVYCHGHTSICTSEGEARDSTDLDEYYQSAKARCVRCANNTDGPRCERCIEGYFRGSENLSDPCRPCECHGHGDTCDPVTGEKCNCGNNTESDASCQSASSSKNSAQECWRYQCVKCRDLYMGDPRNGHQCYKTINIENKLCFDGKSIDECKIKPRPLYPGQTVFVAVNPRYMNVDIRVVVDVTQGAVDLYLSPNDSSFVVSVNGTHGAHVVEIDPAYFKHEPYRKPTFEDNVEESPRMTWHYEKTEYTLADYKAKDLATYIIVDKKNILLRVRDLRNRLVLTLPERYHELGHTKFYIIVRARHSEDGAASFGLVFFRQDQLHIDLFVFFSVFFSCFFLFLAACVVAWKAKQAADVRRARRRHVVEMLHMAKRPFAAVTVVVHGAGAGKRRRAPDLRPVAIEPTGDGRAAVTSVLVRYLYIPGLVVHGAGAGKRRRAPDLRPVAIEPTGDGRAAVTSVLVRYLYIPGLVVHGAGAGKRRRAPDLRPVAIEPTGDGRAAVTSVLVRYLYIPGLVVHGAGAGKRRRAPDLRPVAIEPTGDGRAAVTSVLVRYLYIPGLVVHGAGAGKRRRAPDLRPVAIEPTGDGRAAVTSVLVRYLYIPGLVVHGAGAGKRRRAPDLRPVAIEPTGDGRAAVTSVLVRYLYIPGLVVHGAGAGKRRRAPDLRPVAIEPTGDGRAAVTSVLVRYLYIPGLVVHGAGAGKRRRAPDLRPVAIEPTGDGRAAVTSVLVRYLYIPGLVVHGAGAGKRRRAPDLRPVAIEPTGDGRAAVTSVLVRYLYIPGLVVHGAGAGKRRRAPDLRPVAIEPTGDGRAAVTSVLVRYLYIPGLVVHGAGAGKRRRAPDLRPVAIEPTGDGRAAVTSVLVRYLYIPGLVVHGAGAGKRRRAPDLRPVAIEPTGDGRAAVTSVLVRYLYIPGLVVHGAGAGKRRRAPDLRPVAIEPTGDGRAAVTSVLVRYLYIPGLVVHGAGAGKRRRAPDLRPVAIEPTGDGRAAVTSVLVRYLYIPGLVVHGAGAGKRRRAPDLRPVAIEPTGDGRAAVTSVLVRYLYIPGLVVHGAGAGKRRRAPDLRPVAIEPTGDGRAAVTSVLVRYLYIPGLVVHGAGAGKRRRAPDLRPVAIEPTGDGRAAVTSVLVRYLYIPGLVVHGAGAGKRRRAPDLRPVAIEPTGDGRAAVTSVLVRYLYIPGLVVHGAGAGKRRRAPDLRPVAIEPTGDGRAAVTSVLVRYLYIPGLVVHGAGAGKRRRAPDLRPVAIEPTGDGRAAVTSVLVRYLYIPGLVVHGAGAGKRRRAPDLRPVAIEPTGDGRAAVTSVLVRYLYIPGLVVHGAGAGKRRRAPDLRPVAIEPTGDGRAAVTSVLVRLPGGPRAPVRLALASSLVLVARAPAVRARRRAPPRHT